MANLEDTIALAQGNPGAASFLVRCSDNMITIILNSKIRGTDLYVLWSDLCDKDMMKVTILLANCPMNILEDACSRQDYSGRKLVEQYFNV